MEHPTGQWLKDCNRDVMLDSIRPVQQAGLIDLVDSQYQICDEVHLIPTPGHLIGHVSVQIESNSEQALISGDFIHHPCQLAHPEWSVTTDFDMEQSVTTRQRLFNELSDQHVLVSGTHWPQPTAGYVVREADAYKLKI